MFSTINGTVKRPGRVAASLTAAGSLVRGLPLFVAGRPRTPLRALCIMAFDTVHVLRTSRRLSAGTIRTIAALLDFGACLNDLFDGEGFSRAEYRLTRRLLDADRAGAIADDYQERLRALEESRPLPGGNARQHAEAQGYRESVVRLSLGAIVATIFGVTIDEGIRATQEDEDLEIVFRIVMLCQVIDDVIDFASDARNGLPSFLTAHSVPSQALALTLDAVLRYSDRSGVSSSAHLFPLRAGLAAMSTLSRVIILVSHWRMRLSSLRRPPGGVYGIRPPAGATSARPAAIRRCRDRPAVQGAGVGSCSVTD